MEHLITLVTGWVCFFVCHLLRHLDNYRKDNFDALPMKRPQDNIHLGSRGMRVNTIALSPINTPISGKMGLLAQPMAASPLLIEDPPLRRKGQPEEIASAALYFASDESRFTTGTELRVDGGMTL